MLENTSPYFGFSSHGCFLKNSSKVSAPSMTGAGGGAGGTGAFTAPEMKGAGGAGGTGEAFKAPNKRGA